MKLMSQTGIVLVLAANVHWLSRMFPTQKITMGMNLNKNKFLDFFLGISSCVPRIFTVFYSIGEAYRIGFGQAQFPVKSLREVGGGHHARGHPQNSTTQLSRALSRADHLDYFIWALPWAANSPPCPAPPPLAPTPPM